MAPDDVAARLLEAHVAYQVAQLQGDGLEVIVTEEVDHALEHATRLTLDDVVHRDQVKAVAAKYVATFDLPGAIPEVAGDIADRLRADPANETTLGEVIPRRHVAAAVQKIAELPAIRSWVATRIAESPSAQSWLAEYMYGLVTAAIANNRRLAEKLPGVRLSLSLGEKVAGGAMREADQRSREVAEKGAAALLQRWKNGVAESMADEEFAEALLEVWDRIAEQQMGQLLASIGDDDLLDLVAIVYEGWTQVRTGDYLIALIDAGVDYFFDTYAASTLADLLAEFGLTREDLIEEAMRFAPRAIAALTGSGMLADLLRRRLAPFYASPEVAEILAER